MTLFFYHNIYAGQLSIEPLVPPYSGLYYVATPLADAPFVDFVCRSKTSAETVALFKDLVLSRGYGNPEESSMDGFDADSGFVVSGGEIE